MKRDMTERVERRETVSIFSCECAKPLVVMHAWMDVLLVLLAPAEQDGAWSRACASACGLREVRVRRCDAQMVVPFTWDEEGVIECAFVTLLWLVGKLDS